MEGEIGPGVAVTYDAFNLIEPIVQAACPKWDSGYLTAIFEIPADERLALVTLLRKSAVECQGDGSRLRKKAKLFRKLADWLEARCDDRPICIFGV
jgi:hypothetical protein